MSIVFEFYVTYELKYDRQTREKRHIFGITLTDGRGSKDSGTENFLDLSTPSLKDGAWEKVDIKRANS